MKTPLILCLGLFLGVEVVSANDASVGGVGSDVVLLSEGRIRMVSEDIRFVQLKKRSSEWRVYASYEFRNETDSIISIRMGFPEKKHCDGEDEWGDTYDPSFRNLRISVDGTQVDVDTSNVQVTEWQFCLGKVYVFDVKFPARGRVSVEHTYDYFGTAGVEGYYIDYLTLTGRLWSGPIESASFTISALDVVSGMSWPKEYQFVDHYRDFFPTDPPGSIRSVYKFSQTEWTPTADFEVSIRPMNWTETYPECCPREWEIDELMATQSKDSLLYEMTECLPDSLLRICRNVVYARYGKRFADEGLNSFFYRPEDANDGYDVSSKFWTQGYLINSRYSDELISKEEREFVVLMKRLEQTRMSPKATSGGGE